MYASCKALEDEAKRHRYSVSDTATSGGYGGRDYSGGSWLFKLQVLSWLCVIFTIICGLLDDAWTLHQLYSFMQFPVTTIPSSTMYVSDPIACNFLLLLFLHLQCMSVTPQHSIAPPYVCV